MKCVRNLTLDQFTECNWQLASGGWLKKLQFDFVVPFFRDLMAIYCFILFELTQT